MANADHTNDDLNVFDFDQLSSTYYPNQSWNMNVVEQMDNMQHTHDPRRHVSPLQTTMMTMRQNMLTENSMLEEWQYQQIQLQQQQQLQLQHQLQQQQHQQQQQQLQQQRQQQQQQQLQHHRHHHQQHQQHIEFEQAQNVQALEMYYSTYQPLTIPTTMSMLPITQTTMQTSLSIEPAYMNLPQTIDNSCQDWDLELIGMTTRPVSMPVSMPVSPLNQPSGSPTGSYSEALSHSSSNDDMAWPDMERMSCESDNIPCFVDPSHIHHRSVSTSSSSDYDQILAHVDMGSNIAVYSPTNISDSDYEYIPNPGYIAHKDTCRQTSNASTSKHHHVHPITVPSSKTSSPDRSPASQASATSPGRKSTSKKSPTTAKSTDRVQKKTSTSSKLDSTEKRVGRRKGPLKPEQRKQAGEIRKMRACLRCKFLKKTCDKGDPCAGCQPSHARLWQVPCTRIDIKDIGYFWKNKNFDYERHITRGFSIFNIKDFSQHERTLHVTHGYGHMLPIQAREVYVTDDKCLKMDWNEGHGVMEGYEVTTANLSVSGGGVSTTDLSMYLDLHIDDDQTFVKFVDEYFGGTPFLSQMLKVAFKFYTRTKSPIIKKALKLMLAYCLTLHITMVEGVPEEEGWAGKIEDETSQFHGKTVAPVMINFQIKCAMADMWRELHKDVLEELSSLYSSVYSGDKLKNWPTIFMLASILLAVWECMQFDCHFRVPDEAAVEKFCTDMESTPVGVIVGLFSAISQKLPSILEWDTAKHAALLGSNRDVCDTMTEVRQHVTEHEVYLRERPNAKFDSKDFDCLSNKFLSRLVLRDIRVG